MNLRKFIPKSLCKPTPTVCSSEAARWVVLKHCQAKTITTTLAIDMKCLLSGCYKTLAFPLSAQECLQIIESINQQMPSVEPASCCTDLEFRLLELHIYHIRQWRIWVEVQMADQYNRLFMNPVFDALQSARIEKAYEILTDIRKRLAPPPC